MPHSCSATTDLQNSTGKFTLLERCPLNFCIANQFAKQYFLRSIFQAKRLTWAGYGGLSGVAPGIPKPAIPIAAALLCIAVAETIWADDMAAILCRALSFVFWSCGK